MFFFIWGIIFLIEVLETPDISIYRVRKIYLLQKLFLPRKCLTVDISPVRLETLNTKMTIYSLSNGLSFDKCGFVKKKLLAIKKKRVDNMFQIVKIVVISRFTLPSFGHIKATSLTHYQITFIVYASIPLLTDYCPLTPSLINPFSILQQVRRCHVSKPEQKL